VGPSSPSGDAIPTHLFFIHMADTLSSTINGLQPFIHDGRDHFPQGVTPTSIFHHDTLACPHVPSSHWSRRKSISLPEGKLKRIATCSSGNVMVTRKVNFTPMIMSWMWGHTHPPFPPLSPGLPPPLVLSPRQLAFFSTTLGASAFGYVTVKSYPSTSKSM
jgi:hypothetical protein